MPRPLSWTVMASPALWRVTWTLSAWPLRYSSTALSTISQRRWCRPLASTPPMYIDGRLRTGSRPSRAVRSAAVYLVGAVAVLMFYYSKFQQGTQQRFHLLHYRPRQFAEPADKIALVERGQFVEPEY